MLIDLIFSVFHVERTVLMFSGTVMVYEPNTQVISKDKCDFFFVLCKGFIK